MKSLLSMLRRSPLYYWHTGHRVVAAGARGASALIVVLLLFVMPKAILGDVPWSTVLPILLGFIFKEKLFWCLLLLGLLYFVAPGPVSFIMDFLPSNAMTHAVLGALWGTIQSRLLAGWLFRMREGKTAQPAAGP